MKWRATENQLKGTSPSFHAEQLYSYPDGSISALPLGLRTLRAPPSSRACSSTNMKPVDLSPVLLFLTRDNNRYFVWLQKESEECDKESCINKEKTRITGTRCVLLSEVTK